MADAPLNFSTNAADMSAILEKLTTVLVELSKTFEKSVDTAKKFEFQGKETKNKWDEYSKSVKAILDQAKKSQISDLKSTDLIKKLSKQIKDAGITTKEYKERQAELNDALSAGSISGRDYQASMAELNDTYEKSNDKMGKVAGALSKLKTSSGDVLKSFSNLGAVLGVGLSLSLEALAEKSAKFGKTLFDIKTTAAVTGQSTDALAASVKTLGVATQLSQEHAARFILEFQKGIKTTQLSGDQMLALGKATKAAGIDFEGMQSQQQALIAIQNANSKSVQFLMDNFKNTAAIDAYSDDLQRLYGVSAENAEQFRKTALVMRDPTAFDDDPQVQMAKAMSDLKESALDLELAIAKTLTPAIKWLSEAFTSVMKYVKDNSGWIAWVAAAGAAIVSIGGMLLGAITWIAGVVNAISGIAAAFTEVAAVVVPVVESIMIAAEALLAILAPIAAAFFAVAIPVAVIALSLAEIVNFGITWYNTTKDIAKANEEILATQDAINAAKIKQKGGQVGGLDAEQEQLDKLKKIQAETIKAHAASGRGGNPRDAEFNDRAAEIDKMEAELNKKRQSKLDMNIKAGKSGAGTGVLEGNANSSKTAETEERLKTNILEVTKNTATADKARGVSTQNLLQFLRAQEANLNGIDALQGAILAKEMARSDYLLKYGNDIDGALKSNTEMVAAMQQQIQAQRNIIAAANEVLKVNQDEGGAIKAQSKATAEMYRLQGEVNQKLIQRTRIYDEQKSALDSNIGLAESELSLSKELYLGMGPSLEAQLKTANLYEQKIALVEKEIALAQRLAAERPGDLQAQKNLRDLQIEKNNLKSKELGIVKNLREGYLDSMQAMTNVEGAFSKFILNKDTGVDVIQKQFGAPGGMRAGAVGAGGTEPSVRWGAGGQMQFQGQDEMNKKMLKYDPNAFNPTLNAFGGNMSEAIKQSGTGDFFADQEMAKMGTPGVGSPTPGGSADQIQKAAVEKVGGISGGGISNAPMPSSGAGNSSDNSPRNDVMEQLKPSTDQLSMLNANMSALNTSMTTLNDSMAAVVAMGATSTKALGGGSPAAIKPVVDAIKQGDKQQVLEDKKTQKAVVAGSTAQVNEQKLTAKKDEQVARDVNREKVGDKAGSDDPAKKAYDALVESKQAEHAAFAKQLEDMAAHLGANISKISFNNIGGRGDPIGGPAQRKAIPPSAPGAKAEEKKKDLFTLIADAQRKANAAGRGVAPGMNAAEEAAAKREKDMRDMVARTKPGQVSGPGVQEAFDKYGPDAGKNAKLAELKAIKAASMAKANEGKSAEDLNYEAEKKKKDRIESLNKANGRIKSSLAQPGDGSENDDVSRGQMEMQLKYNQDLIKKSEKPDEEVIKDYEKKYPNGKPKDNPAQEASARAKAKIDNEDRDKAAPAGMHWSDSAGSKGDYVPDAPGKSKAESASETKNTLGYTPSEMKQNMDAVDEANKHYELALQASSHGKEGKFNHDQEMAKFRDTAMQSPVAKKAYDNDVNDLEAHAKQLGRGAQVDEEMKSRAKERAVKMAMKVASEGLNGTLNSKEDAPANAATAPISDSGKERTANIPGMGAQQPDAEMTKNAEAHIKKQAEESKKQTEEQKKTTAAVHNVEKETIKGAGETADATTGVVYQLNNNAKADKAAAVAAAKAAAPPGSGAGAPVDSGTQGSASVNAGVVRVGDVPMSRLPDMTKSMFGLADGGMIRAAGKVPGSGSGNVDTVPAWLAPGEFVMNAKASRENMAMLHAMNNNKFSAGGVIPSPSMARGGGGGGVNPTFHLNVRGDSVDKILGHVQTHLGGVLNDMMSNGGGTSGRFADLANSG